MNYRVVLADDEPEVLRSIQRTLDWEKYGFSVVGAFLNGLDVLEFLENHDVDIVFTDIRMPFMDGIELMHKIKEKYPYIKLVIISGYDDFQYAKEALIHGVLDYILKPINAREMSEVLQKVKDKMDTELEEKQSIQKLRNLYLENQPIIRENFLNRLVVGNIKAKALQEEKKTGLIRMGEYKYWATALAQIYQIEQKDHGETMDSQLASIYIRNLIRNSISDDIYYEAFYNPLGECILFGMNEPEEMEKILLKLNDIAKESKRVMKIKAAIGVGKIKDELIKVKESFEEAKEALSYRKMSQDGDVIYMEDIDKSEQVILLFDEKAQDKLFTAVKFGKEEDIHAVIRKMKEYYVSKICGYLEDEIFQYEKDHPGVEIRKKIADARGSQQEQNDQIDQFISLDYDLLLVNIVDRTNAAVIIDKATQADIPVVFFNREPVREDIFRSDQIYYEGSDAKQSAILQADVIADALEKDRSKIDRNGDSVIQFAMLEGESGHQDTLIRSEWVLKELENKKIPTQQIAGSTGNWEKNQANVIVRQWMKEYPNQIEVIISNNDDMALGAWEALEEKGCTEVQVVGIDGIEEVRELVDEDKILGSVLCDTKLHAKALMQFIDVLAFHNGSVEKLNLENERYYMIPLTKVEK